MKLTYRYYRMFERGMEEGAAMAALGCERSARRVAVEAGFIQKREIDTFVSGYELGRKYIPEWREGKNLLNLAINCGDVLAVDFKLYWSSGYPSFDLID